MYWLQTRAFYRDVSGSEAPYIQLQAREPGASPHIEFTDFQAIDSESSPIRFRACLRTSEPIESLAERFEPYDEATPLNAPDWFGCFDAREVGEALARGEARAFLSVPNIRYGVDRVAAAMPDGRVVFWHQINACGEVVFDGEPPPPGCPPLPESES